MNKNRNHLTVIKRLSQALLLTFLSISLIGCGDDNLTKIKAYVKKVKAKPTERIEPLPQVKQYASVVYSASSLPSPFVPPDPRGQGQRSGSTLAPNLDRPLEPLEAFTLDSLQMVGTMNIGNQLSAIVRDPQGVIYRVNKGNYVGSNYGKISAISPTEIEVNEIVPDNNGGWRLRRAAIVLGE